MNQMKSTQSRLLSKKAGNNSSSSETLGNNNLQNKPKDVKKKPLKEIDRSIKSNSSKSIKSSSRTNVKAFSPTNPTNNPLLITGNIKSVINNSKHIVTKDKKIIQHTSIPNDTIHNTSTNRSDKKEISTKLNNKPLIKDKFQASSKSKPSSTQDLDDFQFSDNIAIGLNEKLTQHSEWHLNYDIKTDHINENNSSRTDNKSNLIDNNSNFICDDNDNHNFNNGFNINNNDENINNDKNEFINTDNKAKEHLNDQSFQSNFQLVSNSIPNHELMQSNTRQNDLRDILSLHTVQFEIYNNPPISYKIFIRLFGRKHMKQAYVQTMSMSDQCIQTDDINKKTIATQCPSIKISSSSSSSIPLSSNDVIKMINFIEKAHKITFNLLIDCTNISDNIEIPKELNNILKTHQIFKANEFTIDLMYSDDQRLYCIHNIDENVDIYDKKFSQMPHRSVVSIYLLNYYTNIEYNLINYSHITCIVSDKRFRLFAGCKDGSISCWDLREPVNMYENLNSSLRCPSYSTACTSLSEHDDSIIDIQFIELSSTYQQLLTADEASLIIWLIIDLYKNNSNSQTDEDGIKQGSYVKLSKIIKLDLIKILSGELSCFKSLNDGKQILFGTIDGSIERIPIFNNDIIDSDKIDLLPQKYCALDNLKSFSAVITIELPDAYPGYFLASYQDGSIHIYNIKHVSPLKLWTSKDNNIRHFNWLNNCLFLLLGNGISVMDIDSNHLISNFYSNNRVNCITFLNDYQHLSIIFGVNNEIHIIHLRKNISTQKDIRQITDKIKFHPSTILYDS